VDANVPVSHVVGDDDKNVRRPTLRLGHRATKTQKAQYDGGNCEHPWNWFHRYPARKIMRVHLQDRKWLPATAAPMRFIVTFRMPLDQGSLISPFFGWRDYGAIL
jgi:hypothetical protein